MRIDVILDPASSPDEVKELGLLAEHHGLATVWGSNYPSSRDPFINLCPLALASSTIRLGPLVITPYELHPYKIAKAVASLNELCAGRANLFIGGPTGVNAAMGMDTERMVGRVKECMEILLGITPAQPFNYQGDIYQVWNYQPEWATAPLPRIYVGANMPQMLHMAAGVADNIMFGDPTAARLEKNQRQLDEHLQSHGRKRVDVTVSALVAWHVKEQPVASQHEARSQLALRGMLDAWYLESFLDPDEIQVVEDNRNNFFRAYKNGSGLVEGVPDAIVDKLVDNLTMSGGPDSIDRHIDTLRRYADLGLDEVALKLHGDQAAAINTIGTQLVPALAAD